MKRALIFIICFVVLTVFIYNKTIILQNNDNTKFEIYLVADNATSAIKNKKIDDIPIEQTPIITDNDPRMDARIKEVFQRLKKLSLYKS
jgi:hypothetical protein